MNRTQIIDEMTADGKTQKEIGDVLGISPQMVAYLSSGYRKGQRVRAIRKLLKVYRWIAKYQKENGYPPSRVDMVKAKFSPSTSVVSYYLRHMRDLKMLEFDPGIARAIRLLPPRKFSPIVHEVMQQGETQ